MADLELAMRDVLLQLALTTNGSTTSWDPSGTTEPDHIPTLGPDDAPHVFYAAEWDAAQDDKRRAELLEHARTTLKHIRVSRGDPTRVESADQRDKRIIENGEGLPALEVARWARCGKGDVYRARAAAGREVEFGRPLHRDSVRKQSEILRLFGEGRSAREISAELGVSYNTVRRALGRNA